MKFIRKNGHVIPIRDSKGSRPARGVNMPPAKAVPPASEDSAAVKALGVTGATASFAGGVGLYVGALANPIARGIRKLGDGSFAKAAKINEAARISARFGKSYSANSFFKELAAKSHALNSRGDKLYKLASKIDPGFHELDLGVGEGFAQIPRPNMKIMYPAAILVGAGAALGALHQYLAKKKEN